MLKKGFILAFLLLFSSPVQAWDTTGHPCTGGREEIKTCVIEIAKKENNPKLCSLIHDYSLLGNLERISDSYFDERACVIEMALYRSDPEICKLISSDPNKPIGNCVAGVAVKTGDYGACNIFEDEFYRNFCFDRILEKTHNPEVCDFMTPFRETTKRSTLNQGHTQEHCILEFPIQKEGFWDELTYLSILLLFVLGIFIFIKASQAKGKKAVLLYLSHPALLVIIYFGLSIISITSLIALFNTSLAIMLLINVSLWPFSALIRTIKCVEKDEKACHRLFILFLCLTFLPTLFIFGDNYILPFRNFIDYPILLPIFTKSGGFIIFFLIISVPIISPLLMMIFYYFKLRKHPKMAHFRKKIVFSFLIFILLIPFYLWSLLFFIGHRLP